MRILENKEKKSILLKFTREIDNEKVHERVYVALSNKEEKNYLKNARDLLSKDINKAAYTYEKDAPDYLFVARNGEEVVFNRKGFEDEREAAAGCDAFFEGESPEIFKDSEVPVIKSIDKRIIVAVVIVFIAIFSYNLINLVWPNKQPVKIVSTAPLVPANLDDNEKEKLKVIGSRVMTEKLIRVISSVRANPYARISAITIQKTEAPKAVSYILTTGKQYQYPEIGAVSTNKGVWGKTETETVALSRSDIKVVGSRDFNTCSLEMLESGFYVKTRDERCVELTYEGDAARTVDVFNSVKDCNVSLNSMDINLGKGKIDVAFCK